MSIRENPYFKYEEILAEWDKQTYGISRFENRVVRHPWTFLLHDKGEADGKKIVHLEHYEGDVIVPGTNISEKFLGNMDIGIAVLFQFMHWALPTIREQGMEIKALKDTQLNGMRAISFYATFMGDMTGVKVVKGYYNKRLGEVSNG